ncbi:hypothetical protein EAX61_11165 [Dokdonia sinensis]|uniref:Thioredoxin-like fold domain-containing protein n=1 Tax=Dokdonia sinensis TaxID=2479847 RepID=A0A3M0FYF1_9FLAO|nr:thioredoxin-like domain-containing protein [Dokdonia sinensis]RMB57664.1 hypothetical protein EAX61_11165 [Dokdonia sinensis]
MLETLTPPVFKLRNYIVIALLSFLSCNNNAKEKAAHTYLGGEIVNPKGKSVSIFKNGIKIGSTPLDSNNRFLYKFGENFKPGLYRFYHGENQVAFIEEGDSLLLRLNTLQFDESVSFSGYGEAKNNLLIDFFLMYENENKILPEIFQRDPEQFIAALDSMLAIRQARIDLYYLKNDPSESFDKLAQNTLQLDNYQRRESYPFSHYGRDKIKFIESLPEGFYDFRESVSLNDEELYGSYSYQRYLNYHLDHLAYMKYAAEKPYNTISYIHNFYELEIIDSLITSPIIKDNMLHRVARNFLANSNNTEEVDKLYNKFNDYVVSDKTRKEVKTLYDNYAYTAAGTEIPDYMVVDPEGRITTLKGILTKPTVLFFWSLSNMQQMDHIHLKVKELKSKYPEYNFIGINTSSDTEKWRKVVKQRKFQVNQEFQLKNRAEALRQLSVNNSNKAIIIAGDGKVLNSHANLYSASFENDLLGYLNK